MDPYVTVINERTWFGNYTVFILYHLQVMTYNMYTSTVNRVEVVKNL